MLQITRRRTRLGVVGALAAAVAVLTASPAGAATVTGFAAAVASNELDRVGFAAAAVSQNLANPNITCAPPAVHGVTISKAVDAYYAEVDGFDTGAAVGQCASLTHASYTLTLFSAIQWFEESTGLWHDICSRSDNMGAVAGVGMVATRVPLVCSYAVDQPAAGAPHRAYARLKHSIDDTATFENSSVVTWLGDRLPAPDVSAPTAPTLGRTTVSDVVDTSGVTLQ